jgi:hypothetical protein
MNKYAMLLMCLLTAFSLSASEEKKLPPVDPVKVTDVWVVFKTHLGIGFTETIEEVLRNYRVNMMDKALGVIEQAVRAAGG